MKTNKKEIKKMDDKKLKELKEEIKELEKELKAMDPFVKRIVAPMVPVKSKGYWKPSALLLCK